MTVARLIERLLGQPQNLEVAIPNPDPHLECPTHLPCGVAESGRSGSTAASADGISTGRTAGRSSGGRTTSRSPSSYSARTSAPWGLWAGGVW